MTKEEAWLVWMKESKNYVEYDWDTIKKSSWWDAFSRGWDAASVNANGWDDAYKMGLEAGKELKKEWVGLTDEQRHEFVRNYGGDVISKLALVKAIEAKLNEKNT